MQQEIPPILADSNGDNQSQEESTHSRFHRAGGSACDFKFLSFNFHSPAKLRKGIVGTGTLDDVVLILTFLKAVV
jgi:hypothetical protein